MPIKELLWALGLTWGVMAMVGCEVRVQNCNGYQTIVQDDEGVRSMRCGKLGMVGEAFKGNFGVGTFTILDVYSTTQEVPCGS